MSKASKPKRPSKPTPSNAARELPEQLRDTIEQRGVTPYELGKAAAVDTAVISRFLSGERDIRLATAGRLATALGLKLVEKAGRVGRPASTKTARPLDDRDE